MREKGNESKLPPNKPNDTAKVSISEERSCIPVVLGIRLGACINEQDNSMPFVEANRN